MGLLLRGGRESREEGNAGGRGGGGGRDLANPKILAWQEPL